MTAYLGTQDYSHETPEAVGVLVTNLGTPAAPTAPAVRAYLSEFLADPRVVEAPRLIWWLVLHGLILRTRPRRSAAAYSKVWDAGASPLLSISKRQLRRLETVLHDRFAVPLRLALGMRYGEPSIADALNLLRNAAVRRLLVLPLYPQYSATTTASTFDAVTDVLKTWRWLPELRFITHYHDHDGYLEALAQSIKDAWSEQDAGERLLFSFHGIPRRYFDAGDPYFCECHKTARLVAERLGLPRERWAVAFQSRLGREEWLRPYTDQLLQEWGGSGIRSVDVACPGFSADCLETLEEIAVEDRDLFLAAGGKDFRYIGALNDRPDHMRALADVILNASQDWQGIAQTAAELEARCQRATGLGAPS